MPRRIAEEKWVLYRHTKDFEMIVGFAGDIKRHNLISNAEKSKLLQKLKERGIFKNRNEEMPLDSINHWINTLAYYMFGYKDRVGGEQRFLFSPLGNLFLKHVEDKQKTAKIFLAMLWAVQFEHPHDEGMDGTFKIYPFRLIFKLLTDSRLQRKLYAYEVTMLLVFIKEITEEGYEALVADILKLRALPDSELEARLRKNEHVHVNASYEWDYYVSGFFQNAGVLKIEEGKVICKLKQGTSTFRKVTRNVATISPELYEFCLALQRNYPYYQKPLALNDPDRLQIDVVKEIYAFFPDILLTEIGEDAKELQDVLRLPELIAKYSNNEDGEGADLFEDILVEGFRNFYNVEARKISGPGNTDIECIYLTKKKKFAVDAKSTKNKLSHITAGRLDHHRSMIGGAYTIVVTPRYVPAVKRDIQNSRIVIILANTFAEYLYNGLNTGDRTKVDYADFDDIIEANLGTDISPSISRMTFEKFGFSGRQL